MIRYKTEPSPDAEQSARGAWARTEPMFAPDKNDVFILFKFYYTYIATPEQEGDAFLNKAINCGWCRSRVWDWYKRNFKDG
jgi:hypothetical protein